MNRQTKNELTLLWGKKVKKDANYTCEKCGRKLPEQCLDPHHIFKTRKKSVKWDPDNGSCLCNLAPFWCHRWAEGHPNDAEDFFLEKRGGEWFRSLFQKARKTVKFSVDDIQKIRERLNGEH